MIQLIPSGETKTCAGHPPRSDAAAARAAIEFAEPSGGFPCGWVLLSGRLIRRGGDYDARLHYDCGEGFADDRFFAIPASGKGIIKEVICLPAGIKRLRLSPMGSVGEIEMGTLTLRSIGTLESRWRMVRRSLAMIFLHSRQKRKHIKLNFFGLLADLQGTYKVASRLRAHAAAPQYSSWIRQFDSLTEADRANIRKHLAQRACAPHFHLLIVSDDATSGDVQSTLASLDRQLYRGFSVVVLDMAESDSGRSGELQVTAAQVLWVGLRSQAAWLAQLNAALADSRAADWVMLVRAGDTFAPHALYQFACEAMNRPEAAVLYADDDMLDEHGQRCRPRFKPDWSLTHLRSTNFVGDAVALRGGEVAKAGGVSADCCRHGSYDLLLRVVDVAGDAGTGRVAHIPAVLLHCRADRMAGAQSGAGNAEWNATQWNMAALRGHLARNGVAGEVAEGTPGCWQVRYRLPEMPPLVSIIVPTRDGLELTRLCLGSLLEKTTYPNFEILVVDNQSENPDALAYLEQIASHERVRVLRYDHPFNYAAMNNFAVAEARGGVVCLLNNDTEVITPGWLDEMVSNLLQPGVGVVGAKLYYANDTIQHGGDLAGVGGVANHAHAFVKRDDPGYCNRAMVAQEYSAVTAACLVTQRDIYLLLGGLDEGHLTVAFNDVDYCLRAREAGYRVVWTPHAELYHYESVSRGKDNSPEKIRRAKREGAYMRKRWKKVLCRDPFYNPNLSYERADFSLSHAPLIERPWLRQ